MQITIELKGNKERLHRVHTNRFFFFFFFISVHANSWLWANRNQNRNKLVGFVLFISYYFLTVQSLCPKHKKRVVADAMQEGFLSHVKSN